MIRIPDAEADLLRTHVHLLTGGIDWEDQLAGAVVQDDFIGNRALAAVAASRVAGVVRDTLRHGGGSDKFWPDLIVSGPSAAWLGELVGRATGIDFMPLVTGEDGRVECQAALAQRYQGRQNVVVVASLLDDGGELAGILKLPEIAGRVLAAVALIDERSQMETAVLGVPAHTIFGGQFERV